MNAWKHLIRQPIRLCAILLLLCTAISFFCLGIGIWSSAKKTAEAVEKQFLTIAVVSDIDMDQYIVQDATGIPRVDKEGLDHALGIYETISELNREGDVVKQICQQRFISAYCPQLLASVTASEDGRYQAELDEPYNTAVFVVSILSYGEPEIIDSGEDQFIRINILGTVEQTLALHPGYAIQSHILITLQCDSADQLASFELEKGKNYLISGTNYRDLDLELRTMLADACRCPVDQIDLSNLTYDLSEFDLKQMQELSHGTIPVAYYQSPNADRGVFLQQQDLEGINLCSLSVDARLLSSNDFPYQVNGVQSEKPLSELLCRASIISLETDVSTFMNTEDGVDFAEAVHQSEVQKHCVAVLGTDRLESIYSFHQSDAFITQGRSFTDEEYKTGEQVCLISETLANTSGSTVGEWIDFSFYWAADPFAAMDRNVVQTQPYSDRTGFLGEAKPFRIVGIYRQNDTWEQTAFDFTPNTVFVPNASLPEMTYESTTGLFYSAVISNGQTEAFRSALAEKGYDETAYACFDNGYQELSATMQSFSESALHLLFASCAVLIGAIGVYLAFFVCKQQQTVGLMLSMGAGKPYAFVRLLEIVGFPVSFSAMIGGITGALLMDRTLHAVFETTSDRMSSTFSSGSVYGHTAAEAMLISLPLSSIYGMLFAFISFMMGILICCFIILRKKPISLIKT